MTARPTAALDEATRPSARLGLSLSPAQRAAGDHLRQVHDAFRGELATLEQRLAQVRRGEASPGEVRAAVSAFARALGGAGALTLGEHCAQLCRFVTMHHSLEDSALFPALGAHAKIKPVVDRLAAEHVVIHEHLEYVDALAARLGIELAAQPDAESDAASDLIGELDEAVTSFATILRSHFVYEETELAEPLGLLGMG